MRAQAAPCVNNECMTNMNAWQTSKMYGCDVMWYAEHWFYSVMSTKLLRMAPAHGLSAQGKPQTQLDSTNNIIACIHEEAAHKHMLTTSQPCQTSIGMHHNIVMWIQHALMRSQPGIQRTALQWMWLQGLGVVWGGYPRSIGAASAHITGASSVRHKTMRFSIMTNFVKWRLNHTGGPATHRDFPYPSFLHWWHACPHNSTPLPLCQCRMTNIQHYGDMYHFGAQ